METTAAKRGISAAHRATSMRVVDLEETTSRHRAPGDRRPALFDERLHRYHHGETKNPAFKRFWLVVHYLVWRCRRVIAGRA